MIFTNPHNADFGFGWHRLWSKSNGWYRRGGAEILNRPMTSLKWNPALVDDACLMLVPGSQRRNRTAYERECLRYKRHADMPGQDD